MNWGNKLLLVFIVFGSGISYMVYRCMQTPVDLVSEHYYKDELAYQQVIDGTRRANALSAKVGLDLTAGGIHIQLPPEMRDLPVRGNIEFYCPSDATRDRNLPLSIERGGQENIAVADLLSGHYRVKVAWTAGGVGYFSEQPLIVP
ncbi:MAG TPA: FixH family protein [Puia sp.]|nr:FixH family protein [Puia sp.]